MRRILFVIWMCLCHLIASAHDEMMVTGLTVNEETNPSCVNDVRLGWKLSCTRPGSSQTAYQLQIDCDGKPVLRTSKVESDAQHEVMPDVSFLPGREYSWRVRVWDEKGVPTKWSERAHFGMAINEDWVGEWICSGQQGDAPLPYLRKSFVLERKKVRRAMVYLCGLGCSQLWMNGKVVDATRVLDPAQTDYEKRALYSAHDVTRLLMTKGENCIGVMLGKGWYSQDKVWTPTGFSYGDPILRCQLNVEYSDGTTQTIGSDETWSWKEGPLLRSNVYQGDEYDARRAVEDWSVAGADREGWNSCQKATGVLPPRMLAQEMRPMRQQDVVNAVRMWKAPGEGNRWIYDFGVNRTANVQFDVVLPAGTVLTTRGAESLTPQGDVDFCSTGRIFIGYQQDRYICAGTGRETWSPCFTYHGFQYVELTVEGTDQQPELSWLKVIPVHTDVAERGTFSCSDSQMNALHQLARQTFLNAFVGLPVDCNQREKCGWLGDTHAYDKAANMNFQMNNFWVKYLEDIRTTSDCYLENTLHHKYINQFFYYKDKTYGIPSMIAPGKRLCGVASPDWGTAVVQLPWHLYLQYGNRGILDDYYDMMALWTRHIDSTAIEDIVYEGLGDWCPPKNDHAHNPTKVEFSSTAFHLIDLQIMAKVASLLGKQADADFFADREKQTREAMIRKFFNPLRNTFGSQTADAMALSLQLIPEGKSGAEIAEALMFDINNTPFRFLNMGIFGLSRFGSALSRNGHAKEAVELYTKKGENSWGLMIDSLKVTTLWESLPYTMDDAYRDLGSHCHPMQGGYDIWFYEDVLGIRPTEEGPGYKHILMEPTVTDCLSWARGTLETAYGQVSSDWRHEGDSLVWDIVIPVGSTAIVALPQGKHIQVNGEEMDSLDSLPVKTAGGKDYYRMESGHRRIVIRNS